VGSASNDGSGSALLRSNLVKGEEERGGRLGSKGSWVLEGFLPWSTEEHEEREEKGAAH